MGETGAALTVADCVLVRDSATVAATVHRSGAYLVVDVLQDAGLTRWSWPCALIDAARRTPGVVLGDDDCAAVVDPETADLVVTLDGPDGSELLAVPGAAVRAALAC